MGRDCQQSPSSRTVRAHPAGWLYQLPKLRCSIHVGTSRIWASGRCWTLVAEWAWEHGSPPRNPSFPVSWLLIKCFSTFSPSHSFTCCICAFLSFTNTLSWLLCGPTFLTATHRSPQLILFDARRTVICDHILRLSKVQTQQSCAGNINKHCTKHTRPDILEHGAIRPLTDHNDTHDETFGHSCRNWHGRTPSDLTLRCKAWPQPSVIAPGREKTQS